MYFQLIINYISTGRYTDSRGRLFVVVCREETVYSRSWTGQA